MTYVKVLMVCGVVLCSVAAQAQMLPPVIISGHCGNSYPNAGPSVSMRALHASDAYVVLADGSLHAWAWAGTCGSVTVVPHETLQHPGLMIDKATISPWHDSYVWAGGGMVASGGNGDPLDQYVIHSGPTPVVGVDKTVPLIVLWDQAKPKQLELRYANFITPDAPPVATIPLAALDPDEDIVVSISVEHPYFLLNVHREAEGMNRLVLVENRRQVVETEIASGSEEFHAAFGGGFAVWSQMGGGHSVLRYWRSGDPIGGKQLFELGPGEAQAYPMMYRTLVAFLHKQTPEKIPLLVYDLRRLDQGDSEACEIDDAGTWGPYHSISPNRPDSEVRVAYLKATSGSGPYLHGECFEY